MLPLQARVPCKCRVAYGQKRGGFCHVMGHIKRWKVYIWSLLLHSIIYVELQLVRRERRLHYPASHLAPMDKNRDEETNDSKIHSWLCVCVPWVPCITEPNMMRSAISKSPSAERPEWKQEAGYYSVAKSEVRVDAVCGFLWCADPYLDWLRVYVAMRFLVSNIMILNIKLKESYFVSHLLHLLQKQPQRLLCKFLEPWNPAAICQRSFVFCWASLFIKRPHNIKHNITILRSTIGS